MIREFGLKIFFFGKFYVVVRLFVWVCFVDMCLFCIDGLDEVVVKVVEVVWV